MSMKKFREYDVVILRVPLGPKLQIGTLGAVVHVHDATRGVYEVEFVDADAASIEVATVTFDQIQLVEASSS